MLPFKISKLPFQSIVILVFATINLGVIAQPHSVTCDTSLRGFATLGSGTTGGGKAEPVIVTTMRELRQACRGGQPAVIRVSGTIHTGPKPIDVGSNKSIIGLNGAIIQGGLVMRSGATNIIIRYLTIKGAGYNGLPRETISARGTSNVWIDHCDISDGKDGLLNMAKGSDMITVSWNKFSYTDRRDFRIACLIGAALNHANLDRGRLRMTFHNNYFAANVTEGMARVRFGQAHFVNNFYNAPENNYVIGVGIESSLLIENNFFYDMNRPITIKDNDTMAYVTETGNIYKETFGDKVSGSINGAGIPFTQPPYAFHAIPAAGVEKVVLACANSNAS